MKNNNDFTILGNVIFFGLMVLNAYIKLFCH